MNRREMSAIGKSDVPSPHLYACVQVVLSKGAPSVLAVSRKQCEFFQEPLFVRREVGGSTDALIAPKARERKPEWKSLVVLEVMVGRVMDELGTAKKVAVRMGSVFHFANRHLLPELAKPTPESPPTQLFIGLSLDVFEAVRAGHLDFGFVSWTSRPKGVKFIEVWRDPVGIVGLRTKFAHIRKARTMADLKDEPWIHFPKPQYEWHDLIEPDRGGFIVRDSQSTVNLVLGGHGIIDIQLEAFTAEERKLLVEASVPSSHPEITIYAIYTGDIRSGAAQFMESLVEKLKRNSRARK